VLGQDISKLYIAVAIRNFALGMVMIFEPVYLYLYFDRSIPATLLFFAVIFGLYAFIAAWGGKIVAALGPAHSILVSFFLYLGYFVFLLFLPISPFFLGAVILLGALGMLFFWPAFHTDLTRFSSAGHRGEEVGWTAVMFLPYVVSPLLGGIILTKLGYEGLFVSVLMVLLAAAVPLFSARRVKEEYEDGFLQAWKRVFSRTNIRETVGFAANGIEIAIASYIWPLYMFLLAVSVSIMGAITSAALVAASLFMLYAGKIADTEDRGWLLNVGAVWTAFSWFLKYFVHTPFDVFLAHIIYRTSRAAAGVPFQTFFYEKAARREREADEYIMYREIVINFSRFLFFGLFALILFLWPEFGLKSAFLAAALFSLAFMLLGKLPNLRPRAI